MNTIQINKILSRSPVTCSNYLGCFPADQIPKVAFPSAMVVNIDPSWQDGSHWIAIFIQSNNSVEYYDSFGIWPPLNPDILRFLNNFSTIIYNEIPLQSMHSKSCGKHAIYFIFQKSLGRSFDEIISRLRHANADRLVNEFVRRKIFDD